MTSQDHNLKIGDMVEIICKEHMPRKPETFIILNIVRDYVFLKNSKGFGLGIKLHCLKKFVPEATSDFKPKKTCKERLSEKIGINISEWKSGRYVSKEQAIAVAYSQINKKYPHCKPYTKSRSKRSESRSKRSKSRSKRAK